MLTNAICISLAKIKSYAAKGKYANTYATYELNGINHVTRSSVQKQ